MRSYVAVIAVFAVIALAVLGVGLLWGPLATPANPLQPLRIGVDPSEMSAPVYIADERGFFAENGLSVTMATYATGEQAIAAADAGDVEVALASEYSVVLAAFGNRAVSVIGSHDRYRTLVVVGRRDSGIASVADLRGKRIGLPRRTISEFYLGRLIERNGMDLRDVTVVDIPLLQQREEAVANGSVDAVLVPNTSSIHLGARLGGNAVVFPAHSDQPAYGVLVCDREWVAAHPRETERLLRALATADEYILADPAGAQAIAARRANLSEENVASAWPNHRFGLSLDRSLLTAMDDEARWMIRNDLTTATAPPEFREYVDTTALARVDPGAVTIQ